MGELITEMFGSFSTVISGLGGGIKDFFMEILYVDPNATEKVISDFAKFGFVMAGLSMALGLGYVVLRKIRS